MYSVKQFSVGKFGKTDNMVIEKLYNQIADHANKNNLKIVKISKMEDGLTSEKITVIFEN